MGLLAARALFLRVLARAGRVNRLLATPPHALRPSHPGRPLLSCPQLRVCHVQSASKAAPVKLNFQSPHPDPPLSATTHRHDVTLLPPRAYPGTRTSQGFHQPDTSCSSTIPASSTTTGVTLRLVVLPEQPARRHLTPSRDHPPHWAHFSSKSPKSPPRLSKSEDSGSPGGIMITQAQAERSVSSQWRWSGDRVEKGNRVRTECRYPARDLKRAIL
eukprot:894506-Rhodomonas_salina.3